MDINRYRRREKYIFFLKNLKSFERRSAAFSVSQSIVAMTIKIFKIKRGSPYIFALITPAPHIAPGMISESEFRVNVKNGSRIILMIRVN